MALSTIYFDPLSPLSLQIPKFFITNKLSSFLLETHCSRHHGIDAHCDKFFTQLGYGIRLPKTTLRAKINWVWARGACKNLGPPTVEASNFKIWYTTWTWGELTKKQLLGPKLAGVRAREHQKNLGPPINFCNR